MKQIFESRGCPYSFPEKRTTGSQALVISGLFRLCRHPMYFFTLLGLIITPVMSLDRLMIIIYTCLYAMIGIPFEERKLVQIFGQDYIDYQKHVPAIFPFLIRKPKMN
jgi:protein-S-isoprenylcysteine O-methyltransferase Ste14